MDVTIPCADGRELAGRWFPVQEGAARLGSVVIACATAVRADYYHRYAAYLAANGYAALTFDYRGIGASRGGALRGQRIRWHEWGLLDIDAALAWAMERADGLPVHLVGHSFGGFGVGLAAHATGLSRILTVGAQHAYWGDYRAPDRVKHWLVWALALPLTLACGYLPGKRLHWMEDLPRGVALDWARSRRDFTTAVRGQERDVLRAHLRALTAPVLALAAADDPYATRAAMERAVDYSPASPSTIIQLRPEDYGQTRLGHFALFHSSYEDSFWPATLAWLREGTWPGR
ncbi:alpha/beta hydrolase family protein [Specibacter sp. RAF43]|uniref:alpha/beta hydrolase family protein n=1 Tax=Specibacter sp. RAF43 TaxID=3233057 RepID=UPI003F9BBC5D